MRKAKIICTMGPASREEPALGKLVEAGMDVARLNFSHGTHDDHLRALAAVRKASDFAGRPIGVLLDLQGPKIRVGKIEGGKVKLETGAETIISVEQGIVGAPARRELHADQPGGPPPGDLGPGVVLIVRIDAGVAADAGGVLPL